MTERYRCPKCKSSRVMKDYPEIKCLSCGHSEELIDFPISWNIHRNYCQKFGYTDPGHCYPEEVKSTSCEESPPPDLDRDGYKRIHALEVRVQQLTFDLGNIYSKLASRQQAAAITRKAREGKQKTESNLGAVPL
jgi:hypothetical protein